MLIRLLSAPLTQPRSFNESMLPTTSVDADVKTISLLEDASAMERVVGETPVSAVMIFFTRDITVESETIPV